MTERNDTVANPTSNNTIGDAGSFVPGLVGGALRYAWKSVWHGAPRARRTMSLPFEGVLPAWMPWIQTALALILFGVVLAAGVLDTWAYAVGGVLALAGLVLFTAALVVSLAVDATLPTPRRFTPPAAGDPLRPHDVASGLVALTAHSGMAQQPLVMYGLRCGARMTVLDSGAGLVVYSPIEATEPLLEAVRQMGEVRWIVAPNTLHHMFVGGWAAAFPEASLVAAPGLADRRPDLPWTATIGSEEHAPWPTEHIEMAVFRGHAFVEEIVLLHKPSKTLVVADVIQNYGQDPDAFTASQQQGFKFMGMWQRPGPPIEWKFTVVDEAAVRKAAERVLTWDFDTILLAHGPIITSDAREVFSDGFAFVR